MPEITIYTKFMCGYCERAKRLLAAKGVNFTEHDVTFDSSLRKEMEERAGGPASLPQIFVGNMHVGGSDNLAELEQSGELDALLSGKPLKSA